MEKIEDIRWKQRFENYIKALALLGEAVSLSKDRDLTDLESQGLIQRFEFTRELAWNVMKDYFEYQGNTTITGSRDATREAFNKNLIVDGDKWMEMIKSRNSSTHTYNESVSNDIILNILKHYYTLFLDFKLKMNSFI